MAKRDLIYTVLSITLLCTSTNGDMCIEPKTPTKSFCARPPVDEVKLPSYLGTWYQAYANRNALFVTKPECVAARYTARPNNKVGVLNCYYIPGGGMKQPQCVEGEAEQQPNSASASRLQVSFGSTFTAGAYIIAALLGEPEYGYYAVAVYSCSYRDGKPRESWFILVRNPYRPEEALRQLLWRLQCKGYNVRNVEFLKTKQGQGCKYWDGPDGYATRPPQSFTPSSKSIQQ